MTSHREPLEHGTVLLCAPDAKSWLLFRRPVRQIRAEHVAEVLPAFAELEAAVNSGLFAAGFVTYEAAPAFDSALRVIPCGSLPLLWFGLYKRPENISMLPVARGVCTLTPWLGALERDAYRRHIASIKERIAAGDTYQINFTQRLRADFAGDPFALFAQLWHAQPVPHAAFVTIDGHSLCCGSPELFFERRGRFIQSRPMKGTAARGVNVADDRRRMRTLQHSAKDRAENVMIVDMVRNDLGRIAQFGSVRVPRLFAVEHYATVLQMTSTVTARTDASLTDVFRALFPCASVTGAPKVNAMRIIAEAEAEPRGIYTGAIGFAAPNRIARFNVAIRTLHLDHAAGMAVYGTGGGIVWDSRADDEYDECLLKAQALLAPRPTFQLLETMRWDRRAGFFLRRRHVRRLCASARYFNIPLEAAVVERKLAAFTENHHRSPLVVRLLVAQNGAIVLHGEPLDERRHPPVWTVALASLPVDERDCFLHHKTTHRAMYDEARTVVDSCDDVVLWNSRGEITEATRANVAAKLDGEWVTPPVNCGLLAGTYRAELLARRRLRERIVTKDDFLRATEIALFNSVRKWIPAALRKTT